MFEFLKFPLRKRTEKVKMKLLFCEKYSLSDLGVYLFFISYSLSLMFSGCIGFTRVISLRSFNILAEVHHMGCVSKDK